MKERSDIVYNAFMKVGDDAVLTLKQAAKLLDLSPETLRLQVRKKKLSAFLAGKTYLVLESEVERYRREHLGRFGNYRRNPTDPHLQTG
ncbi:MAG: helix-turn-helix domain-containing protein [Thermomicrobiales bacterium]